MKKFIFILLSCLLGAQTLSAGQSLSNPKPKKTSFYNKTSQILKINLTTGDEITYSLEPEQCQTFFTEYLKKYNHILIRTTIGRIIGITFATDCIVPGTIIFKDPPENSDSYFNIHRTK
ncbi:MAG: hypothetical protein WC436_03890 [Candidatus Babeliales bacterium]